jgi:hypothetical protein
MDIKKEIELANKSVRNVPVLLWYKFVGHCKTNNKTVTQGIIEAVTLWMNKEG